MYILLFIINFKLLSHKEGGLVRENVWLGYGLELAICDIYINLEGMNECHKMLWQH